MPEVIRLKLLVPIEGFEEEAEFRLPKRGETYIGQDGKLHVANEDTTDIHDHRIVLTPCRKWRPATKQDVIDSLAGIEFPTRVRDWEWDKWKEECGSLCGYRQNNELPWICENNLWAQCEVQR
jgi:hypothetical protein